MNSVSTALGMVMALCLAFTAKTIYDYSGWKWKVRPWVPFGLGFLLLCIFVLLSWHLDQSNSVAQRALERSVERNDTNAITTIAAAIQGQQWELKLIELIGIPLAVSLLTTALSNKVDHEYGAKLLEFEKYRDELAALAEEIKGLETELIAALESGLRGKELISRWQHVCFLNRRLILKLDRKKTFEPLINSNLVRDLDDSYPV
uniref:Uncharacterized protein n=1 Tax=Curvibacter symbiont subsp. Hydra magnipapillata TaxID=667019 RepID=C9Y726_CURXX|nr:hypothetical protein Csp_H40090 [Curvibacter putative symbiont of Hydra magnipapillata]